MLNIDMSSSEPRVLKMIHMMPYIDTLINTIRMGNSKLYKKNQCERNITKGKNSKKHMRVRDKMKVLAALAAAWKIAIRNAQSIIDALLL